MLRAVGGSLLLVLCAWLAVCPASANADADDEQESAVVLRPTKAVERFAARIARTLERRTPWRVVVGEPPPADLLEAVPAGQVALSTEQGELTVTVARPGGQSVTRTLNVARLDDGAARATALMIEALFDEPLAAPPREQLADDDSNWWFIEYRKPDRHILPIARPTFALRFGAGYSPADKTALLGPGVGFGLCVREDCLVFEAEVPLIAQQRQVAVGERVSYRAVRFGLRLQYRPFRLGPVSPGLTAGLVTRVGNAVVQGPKPARVSASDLGFRTSIELGIRVVHPFEIVLEGGTDILLDPARVQTQGSKVKLSSEIAPWAIAGLRVRP